MFDNTITFIIVLLVVLFVVIMKKIKSKKSTDCHKANKKKHKYPDAKKIFNNDFDIDNPPILIPYLPEATNHKKHRGTT